MKHGAVMVLSWCLLYTMVLYTMVLSCPSEVCSNFEVTPRGVRQSVSIRSKYVGVVVVDVRCFMSIFDHLRLVGGLRARRSGAFRPPDLAVGSWAWVKTRVNRRSPAARARARRGR